MWLPGGGGRAWLLGGVRGCWGGHAWLLGGMRGCWGGYVVAGGHAWLAGGGMHGCPGEGGVRRIRRDTVNERAVRILLECILVGADFTYLLTWLSVVSSDCRFRLSGSVSRISPCGLFRTAC